MTLCCFKTRTKSTNHLLAFSLTETREKSPKEAVHF